MTNETGGVGEPRIPPSYPSTATSLRGESQVWSSAARIAVGATAGALVVLTAAWVFLVSTVIRVCAAVSDSLECRPAGIGALWVWMVVGVVAVVVLPVVAGLIGRRRSWVWVGYVVGVVAWAIPLVISLTRV